MKNLKIILSITIALCIFLVGCKNGDTMSANELKSYIHEHLNRGASEQEIIDFLEEQNWSYNYNNYDNRYQARKPEEDKNKWVRNYILLYLDESHSLDRVEVETWHAAP
ncbi:hypothetical protein GV054_15290 [Marinomonas mediterranea]|uniref:Lipoprotein n=1 Tax=Marinomonas mediterranea (strain ATCC 700492 / JCM 21426 / NBRC 103028 / MMB-1) TaxID=717774 RepID=F2K1M7_MARM1|nr:hypothetical protein [Marinomonas mediterranea]ADZ92257.1 hypothetical protein Marme_3036 [Marinomonas mediterranea MMB-1]WCN14259.1 hypothetical protein GV054_15290 [Marinomonas mediterranea]WCN18314.1 hypothetical protein GV053_15370 [Marinomonas mediterranea MMB-1]